MYIIHIYYTYIYYIIIITLYNNIVEYIRVYDALTFADTAPAGLPRFFVSVTSESDMIREELKIYEC